MCKIDASLAAQPCRSRKVCRVGKISSKARQPPLDSRSTKIPFVSILSPGSVAMTSFFDIKARKEAAVTNGSTSKAPATKETTRLQPWVEK
jgi:hypothetical protein